MGGHSDEFCAFKAKHALFFVIPAKAGMTKGSESREAWAEEWKKGATQNRDRK
jgi:hypothetical protein